MYIYRIEHKESGYGPYNPDHYTVTDDRIYYMGKSHLDDDHPSVRLDCHYNAKKGYAPSDYYCGFRSMKDLDAWFNGWLDILHNNNFHLVMYSIEAKYVFLGKKQVSFVKERATKIKESTLI